MAVIHQRKEKYSLAESYYQQALDIAHKVLGENHPYTIAIQQNLESLP
jgi:Tfp pilus assembly protein PilF